MIMLPISFQARLLLLLLLLLLTFSPEVVLAQDPDTTPDPSTMGCFDYRNLTCNIPLDQGDQFIDVNSACLAMESTIYGATGQALRLVKSDQDTYNYQQRLSFLTFADDLCYGAHQAYHKCWWCAQNVPDSFCKFETCEKPSSSSSDNNNIMDVVNVTATCEELQTLHDAYDGKAYPATIEFCHRAEASVYACPDLYCDEEYLGADTERKRKSLVWLSRTAAFLSLLGASYILWDVISNKKNRKLVYNQLLFGMAVFDVFTALAWAFATAPVPSEKFWVYGAAGNMGTCKTQAFFVQLGFTSVFYNVSLALYYVLVIVRDWREFNLVKIRPYMHGIPILLGLGLAFAGINFYDWFEYGCHLLPPPQGEMWQVLVFAVLPIGISICCIAAAMMTVYCKVRTQANKAKKWSMGNKGKKKGGARNVLERTVFYQSIFYVMSFLISWPILFAMYLASVDVDGPYGLTATIAFVAPLQGFNNFLVYIRPKVNQWRRERQKKKEKKQKIFNSSTAATAGESGISGTGGFFRRLRGSTGSSAFRISSHVSFFKRPSKEFEGAGAAGISNVSSVSSNTNASFNMVPQMSMSNFDRNIDGLNSNSLSHLSSNSEASTVQNSFTTYNASQEFNLESDDEFQTEDPSVLIARADLEEVLKKHEELEERREHQQEQQQQKVQSKATPNGKPSAGAAVPETVDEEGESELISTEQTLAAPHTVAPMPDTIDEEKDQTAPKTPETGILSEDSSEKREEGSVNEKGEQEQAPTETFTPAILSGSTSKDTDEAVAEGASDMNFL